jgi:hypothetical protein
MLHAFRRKQPGDPAKAAAAVLRITSIDNPPLRLILGSDASQAIEQNDLAKLNSDRQWKELDSLDRLHTSVIYRLPLLRSAQDHVCKSDVDHGFSKGSTQLVYRSSCCCPGLRRRRVGGWSRTDRQPANGTPEKPTTESCCVLAVLGWNDNSFGMWYARVDSNHRPFAPEANALSS